MRLAIIGIYEYDYNVLIKLEEEYHEAQFYKNYFHTFNTAISPWATFDERGNMNGLAPNAHFEGAQLNELLVDIWKIRGNRMFIMQFYREVDAKIDGIISLIDQRAGE